MSTLDLPSSPGSQLANRSLRGLYHTDGAVDIAAVTAARLSSTFPYVTPIARADYANPQHPDDAPAAWHIADGGYFDNFGVVAAVEWIRSLLRATPAYVNQLHKIVIVQIRPFPETVTDPPTASQGWFHATLGPVRTVLKVRTSTQIVRNELEIQMLQGLYPGLVESVVFRPQAGEPPLSWHLSANDQAAIDAEWKKFHNSQEIGRLRAIPFK
jgi:hypothetical protein